MSEYVKQAEFFEYAEEHVGSLVVEMGVILSGFSGGDVVHALRYLHAFLAEKHFEFHTMIRSDDEDGCDLIRFKADLLDARMDLLDWFDRTLDAFLHEQQTS